MSFSLLGKPTSPDPSVGRVVLEEAAIRRRVAELGEEIRSDYQGRNLRVAGVLRGAQIFTCDLIRRIDLPLELDFIAVSPYSLRSGSGVRILKDLEGDLQQRHLLLIEDIVDTGLTMHHLVGHLKRRHPASLSVCTLLDRPGLRLVELPIRYVGFEVCHEFLVGYGLDYRNRFRDLPYIATLS